MERSLLSLAFFLFLQSSAWAFLQERSPNMSFAPSSIKSILPQSASCKGGAMSVMSLTSEDSLTGLFNNIACSGAGEVSPHEKMDYTYCSALSKCSLEGKDNIPKEGRAFLRSEAQFFLIRELTDAEMNKYLDKKKTKFTDLLDYVERLPASVKNKINKCQEQSPEGPACSLGDSVKTEAMQNYIREILQKNVKNNVTSLLDKNEEFAIARMTKATQESSFADLFNIMKETEGQHLSDSKGQAKSSDADPVIAKVFVDVVKKAKMNNVEQMSDEEITGIIKATLIKVGDETQDDLFSYRSDIAQQVERALAEIKFSASDFKSNTPGKSLSDKLNEVRIRIANSYLAKDCQKYNSSLEQVCSNVALKFKNTTAYDILSNFKEDPFAKMISFYKASKYKSKDETVAKLSEFAESKAPVVKKYLVYSLQKNICFQIFPSLKPNPDSAIAKDESQEVEQRLKEMRESVAAGNDEMIALVREAAKTNSSFQREISDLGINLNLDSHQKAEPAMQDIPRPLAKADFVAARDEDFNSSRGLSTENAAFNRGPQKEQVESIHQEINNTLKNETSYVNGHYESKLRTRLAELESKERALTKKMAQKDEESSTSADDKTLNELRKQIEELKKSSNSTGATKRSAGTNKNALDDGGTPSSEPGSASARAQRAPNESGVPAEKMMNTVSSSPANMAQGEMSTSSAGVQRSPASGASLASETHAQSKSATDKSVGGLILTKNGEVFQDPANIIENPKEGDIVSMLEVTNGQPFLIRENGVLMKVVPELDAEGRPQVVKGRLRFKKERLTKAQQEELKKDPNIQKSLKEVGRDPTRLYNLKKLLQTTVKRD